MNIKSIWGMIRETFNEWSEDKAPRLAAALSYYTIFSLAPLLVLVIAIASFIIGNNEQIRQQVIGQVTSTVGQQAGQTINELITNSSQPRTGILATILGIVALIMGATGVFGQLQDALNTIWEVQPQKGGGILNMIKDRFLSFSMVLGTSFLLLVSLVISAGLSFVNRYFTDLLGGVGNIAQIINFVISIGVVTLIFAMIFRYLPDAEIEWRDVWIGALVTALLFNIGKWALSLYLSNAGTASAYGAAGSLVLLLLWVYYSAQILFMGAEFTQVYARRHGSRIAASPNARKLTEDERVHQGIPRKQIPVKKVQDVLIPVVGQPAIREQAPVERVNYNPPNPARVIPVIALGTVATAITLTRVVRKIINQVF